MRTWVSILLLTGACATARPGAPAPPSAVCEAAEMGDAAPVPSARSSVVVPPFPDNWGAPTTRTTFHAPASAGFGFDDAGAAHVLRDRMVFGRMRNVGHPTGLPGHPVGLPGHAVRLPRHALGLPAHSVRLPGQAVGLPGQAVGLPGQAVGLPGQAVGLPGQAVGLPGQAVGLPGQAVGLPGHAVGLPSHPIRPANLRPQQVRTPRAERTRRDRRTGPVLRHRGGGSTQRNLSVNRARGVYRHTG